MLSAARETHVTGLTATPRRRDGLHPIAEMQLGPVRHVLTLSRVPDAETVARRLVVRQTSVQPESLPCDASIQEVCAALARDNDRNVLIASDVVAAVEAGRRVLVLTERVEQLVWLQDYLIAQAIPVAVLHGGLGAKNRKKVPVPETLASVFRKLWPVPAPLAERRPAPAGASCDSSALRG